MKAVHFFFVFILLAASCNRNETPKPDNSGLFIKFFGSASYDAGFSVAETSDGNFVISGTTISENQEDKDIYIVKLDQNGNMIWETTYGGDFNDEGKQIIESSDGHYILTGYEETSPGLADVVVLEIDPGNGVISRNVSMGSPETDERGFFLAPTADNSYVILGVSRGSLTSLDPDMFLGKTNLNFSEWEKKVGIMEIPDSIGAINELSDGSLIWCGSALRDNGSDLRIIKSDGFGNVIWDYGFQENDQVNQVGHDLQILDMEEGFIAAGSVGNNPDKDIFLVKTTTNGEPSMDFGIKQFEKPGSQEAFSVTVTEVGDYVITGYTVEGNSKNVYVASFSQTGDLLWEKSFGGKGDDVGRCIRETSDGGFLIIGTVTAANNTMMAVYKINSQGELYQ